MENMTQDELNERIEMLEQAQAKIFEAVSLIQDALYGTCHQGHSNAYLVAHLREWGDSPAFNMGVTDYMDALNKDFEENN